MVEQKRPHRLAGKRALVTGASSGIGKEIALLLASWGCDLVITARRKERLEALAALIEDKHGVCVDVVPLDFTEPDAPDALFAASTSDGRRVDILVNNAGMGTYEAFDAVDIDTHLKVIQLNVVSLVKATWLFLPHMKEVDTPCHILNIASIAAFQPTAYYAIYAPTKSFVRDFTEALDYEQRDTNVWLTCACPGGTWTEFADVAGITVKKSHEAAMMSAETCARLCLEGMLKRRRLVVTGFVNALLCWLLRFVPRRAMPLLAHKTLGDPPSVDS